LHNKPLIFVVISVLVVALVYSPAATTFYVFAAPPNRGFLNSESCNNKPDIKSGDKVACCWNEHGAEGITFRMCQQCTWTEGVGYSNCNKPRSIPITSGEGIVAPLEEGVLEQPPTPSPSGPAAPLQDGGVLQQTPGQGAAPPLTRDQGVLPQDGVLQQEPTDEGTESTPRTVEPPAEDEATQPSTEPVTPCPDGLVFDEETDLCVLEEPPVTETPEQQDSSD
jgi:hypothetical protein